MKITKRLLLALFPALLLLTALTGFSANYEERFHYAYRVAPRSHFRLENVTGRVSISGWNKDYIDIVAVKRSSRSQRDLERVSIEIGRGAVLSVTTVYQRLFNVNARVEYEVKIPAGVIVDEARNITGDLTVTGVAEIREARVTTGDLTLEAAKGPTIAKVTTGSITIRLSALTGDSSYRTITGGLNLYLRPTIAARIEAGVTTGSIVNHGLTMRISESSSRGNHLRAELGRGGPELQLSIVTGSINLHTL